MLKRNIIHISMVCLALLLAFMTKPWALACTVVAFLFNLFIYPKIAKDTFKPEDIKRGYQTGVILYPVSVFLLILVFPMHIAAGAWAVMALGDGMASLAGRRWGAAKLPWNGRKSIVGLIAFVFFGTFGCFFFTAWVLHFRTGNIPVVPLFIVSSITACAAGVVECLPTRFEDNLTVPLFSGAVLWASAQLNIPFSELHSVFLWGILFSGVVAIAAYMTKSVDFFGSLSGVAIGTAIYTTLGLKGFGVLLVFFAIGTASTKFGMSVKLKKGVAEKKRGARGAGSVIANGGVAVGFAALAAWASNPDLRAAAMVAFAGSLAAAAADTVAGEVGQVLGKKPIMITTFKPAPIGENGAVTITGLIAGTAAASVVAVMASAFSAFLFVNVVIITAAGTIGNIADSFFGATYENKGSIGNHEVNFLCALTGALTAFILKVLI